MFTAEEIHGKFYFRATAGDYFFFVVVAPDNEGNFGFYCIYKENEGIARMLCFGEGDTPMFSRKSSKLSLTFNNIEGVERQLERCYQFFKAIAEDKDKFKPKRTQSRDALLKLKEKLEK